MTRVPKMKGFMILFVSYQPIFFNFQMGFWMVEGVNTILILWNINIQVLDFSKLFNI